MQNYNQLINQFNIFNLFVILLFSLLPISILIGNAGINLNILFIDLIFLIYCIKHKQWSWLKSKFFILLLILYLFLILNSVFSYFYIVEDEITGLKRSILFIKFIILTFAFSVLLKDKKSFDFVNKSWLLISLIVIFDIFYEKYFGYNILGFASPSSSRVVSFFKDELVVGGYVMCFGFTSATYYLNKNLNQKTVLYFLIIVLFILISIFLTGERSNFIKFFILFLVVIYFFNKQNFILNTKVLIPIFIISISCIIYFTDSVKDRYSDFIKRIYIETQTTNIIHVIGNNRYGAHFDAALKIFKNYPLSGVGNKNFRSECLKDKYYDSNIKFSRLRCSTHPHQIHFEILSEQGILGYLIIIYILGLFIIKNVKVFLRDKNINHLNNITYIILFFLPLLPGAGIFGTFNGSIFWIIFSLCYLNYKNTVPKI